MGLTVVLVVSCRGGTPSSGPGGAPSAGGSDLFTGALTGHSDAVSALAFSPDGHTLASGGADGTVRFWDTATGKQTGLTEHEDPVLHLAYSGDGSTLVGITGGSESMGGELWLADAATGAVRTRLPGQFASDIAVHPSNGSFAVADGAGSVHTYEAATGAMTSQATVTPSTSWVDALRYSPDGAWLAVSAGALVRLWDAQNPAPRAMSALVSPEFMKMDKRFTTFAASRVVLFSPDSQTVITPGALDGCRLWEVNGAVRSSWCGTSGVSGAALAPDGRSLVTFGVEGGLHVWSMTDGSETYTFTGHLGGVTTVSVHPKGGLVASGGKDRIVRLWKAPGLGTSGAAKPAAGD
ncbi:WD40 repeat domain-containing protein [Streptomyces yangpuensis]|uniref:WD40 repeat domain-containing protein n=1 Tax=Streptomyces yangpuensis TaxID=1648182 RepID=UPI0038270F0F